MPVSLRAIRRRAFRIELPGDISLQARAGIREYLEVVKKQLIDNYDTAAPSPHYTRRKMRGGVMSGWRIHVRSNNFGDLINNIRGVEYVQGRYRVPRHRKAGWKTVNQIAHDTRPLFPQIMNRRILPRRRIRLR